jgi:hypothetical protein
MRFLEWRQRSAGSGEMKLEARDLFTVTWAGPNSFRRALVHRRPKVVKIVDGTWGHCEHRVAPCLHEVVLHVHREQQIVNAHVDGDMIRQEFLRGLA